MNLTGNSEVSLKEGLERLKTLGVPELFAEKVAAAPDVAAIRFKRDGVFQEFTWTEIASAYAPRRRGLSRSESRPEIASPSWATCASSICWPISASQ